MAPGSHPFCANQKLLWTQKKDTRVLRKHKWQRNPVQSFLIHVTSLYWPTTYSENYDIGRQTWLANTSVWTIPEENPVKLQPVTPKASISCLVLIPWLSPPFFYHQTAEQLPELYAVVYYPVKVWPEHNILFLEAVPSGRCWLAGAPILLS